MAVMFVRKIIALYLRISKRDKEKEDFESNSIGNQREILYEYVENHLDSAAYEVREFVDDGYSGTSMNRPAMQELLALIQEGRIYAVLVKDLSRFARNYIELGNYMEKLFPYIGVRFISVNDQYDSDRITNRIPGIDVAFKGIIHDYYCKELSQKLKTARKLQVKKGKSIMAKPPYGYWKSNTEKGLLVVDRETAPIVQMIFRDYQEGMSAYKIAQELNKKRVDSPNKRLERAGMIHFDQEYAERSCWNTGTVLSILKNRVYIGDAVGNKSERTKISINRCRKLKEGQWIIVENTHEPIVEKEVFELVQQRLIQNSCPREKADAPEMESKSTVFRGRLICGNCNSVMVKNGENKGIIYYNCAKCRMSGRKTANVHSDFLEKKILEELPECFRREKAVLPGRFRGETAVLPERKADANESPEAGINAGCFGSGRRDVGRELLFYYEKYAEGLISKQEYLAYREKLQNVKRNDSGGKETLDSSKGVLQEKICDREEKRVVDRRLVERCISRIIVENGCQIRIVWKAI